VGTATSSAITTTVQCVSGVVDFAVKRIKAELLPKYPNVDDGSGWSTAMAAGSPSDAPDATCRSQAAQHRLTRTSRRGGEPRMREAAPNGCCAGHISIAIGAAMRARSRLVRLQTKDHIGFMSMIDRS